jgi:hypothetical protein
MQNYLELSFPFELVRKDFKLPELTSPWPHVLVDAKECLTIDAINEFRNLGFENLRCQLFRGSPNTTALTHSDIAVINGTPTIVQSFAINIVWGSTHSVMRWFVPLAEPTIRRGDTGNLHLVYQDDMVELIEEYVFTDKPVLCNVHIPHNVTNFDNANARWCLSIRDTSPRFKWPESVKFFEKYAAK